MRSCFRCRHVRGLTYVELLAGLVTAALLFAPAYQFASMVLAKRAADSWRNEEAEMALEVLSRDIRCAAAAPSGVLFQFHSGVLTFTVATSRGLNRVDYECRPETGNKDLHRNGAALCTRVTDWNLKFFDGENWRIDWGWNSNRGRPSEGVRGLPLAIEIEIRAGDGVPRRRVVPVMAAVIERWVS